MNGELTVMTDQMQSIRDDIAYLRALAEEGRESGQRGGAVGMAAGVIFAACSVVQWAALMGYVGGAVSNIGWIAGTVLFFIALAVVKARMGATTGRSRAVSVAWEGVGWAIFVLFLALAAATWRTRSVILITFAPSIILALYGAAWSVAASLSGKRWMKLAAFGSFAAAVLCAWFIAEPVQYLVYAAALLLLAALPGAVMMRQETARATTVQATAADR
jgi:hypothetical protein